MANTVFISYKNFDDCHRLIREHFNELETDIQFYNIYCGGGEGLSVIVPSEKTYLKDDSKKEKCIRICFRLKPNMKKLDDDLECCLNTDYSEQEDFSSKKLIEYSIKFEIDFAEFQHFKKFQKKY